MTFHSQCQDGNSNNKDSKIKEITVNLKTGSLYSNYRDKARSNQYRKSSNRIKD